MADLVQGATEAPESGAVTPAWWNGSQGLLIGELARRDMALRLIWDIVHTPTKATSHKSAERHFGADFDAIRKLIAPFVNGER